LGQSPLEADLTSRRPSASTSATRGTYDRATQDFDQAIKLKPDYPNAFMAHTARDNATAIVAAP